MAELNPNAVTGLSSNLNTREIIGRFIEIEKRKAAPIEKRKEEKVAELDSWNAVKVEVEKLHDVVKNLTKNDIWEAKSVESSDPTVIAPKATRRAKPGKTNIAVDAVALANQITSQGFEDPTQNVGTGTIKIQVGDPEERPEVTVNISQANNTLEGLKDAINDSEADVEAFVIKTGSSEKPYQLLLTSEVTGEEGKIEISVDMKGGDVDPPRYTNSFDETSEWEGVGAEEPTLAERRRGSSTPITGVRGTFTGEEDTVFTFTATQGGIVNSEQGVVISWTDDQGRSGSFNLNKFNYSPGQFLEFADGLSLALSDGEVIDGDSFTVRGFAERSELLWWLSDEQRQPRVEQPSPWAKQSSEGGIHVEGTYTGDEDQTLVLRVEGSGQVGGPKPLFLHYEFTETGETGRINIGFPYLSNEGDPNTLESATAFDFEDGEGLFTMDFLTRGGTPNKLSLGNGLTVELPPGIVSDGDTAMIDLRAQVSDALWWLREEDRGIDGKVDEKIEFEPFLDPETGEPLARASVADGILPFGGQRSTSIIEVSGEYEPELPRTYTFTAQKRGSIGITRVLEVQWEDNLGNTGVIDFGEGYKAGTPIPFDAGLFLALGEGELVKDDQFVINTRTSTVQVAQDAVLRLGASDLGGGIEIRRPTNTITDVIEGVELELLSTSEKPVTITVKGDTERAKENLRDFVDAYNTLNATITEVTKFDPATQTAAPLLSDRNVNQLYNDIANTTISAVRGLPQSTNMLFSIGLRIDDKGNMSLNESRLDEKINDDFASVANIFRSNGESDNTGITFLGLSEQTRISPTGYKIDVEQVATQGTYTGTLVPPLLRVTEENNEIVVVASGRRSEPIQLREDTYTIGGLARSIQSKLADDKRLGSRRIRVVEDEGRLKFTSGVYGANSTISVEPGRGKDLDSLGLEDGEAVGGLDVSGFIDGLKANGRGQLLIGAEGTDAEGLRLFVNLDQDQTKIGAEANVVITKGVGVQLDGKMKELLDPADGSIKKYTSDIASQMRAFDEQIERINERIDSKQSELQIKFAKLESTLGRLKAEQNYLGQQLSALSGNKKDKK